MCDWRKLLRPVKSRPEIEIADKRLAFSIQIPSIEPSFKTGPQQVKISISPIAQGFLKNFRVQHVVALTVRGPKHPCLAWCNLIFLYENFSRLVPRVPNLAHHRRWWEVLEIQLPVRAPHTICDFYHTNFRHICSRTCQRKSSHLGTKIAIPFPIFTFRSWFLSQIVYTAVCRIARRVFLDHF